MIAATAGDKTSTANLTVYGREVTSIVITPPISALHVGRHVRLYATAYDQRKRVIHRSPAWSSGYPPTATVDSTGLVTAVAPGPTVAITARVDDVQTSLLITVLYAPPAPSIDGDWTMTLAPSLSCRDRFPTYARERTYTVHFSQDGADFGLTIAAPTLEVANEGENFGWLLGTEITFFFIGDTDYDTWSFTDLHDHLSPTETLDFTGQVTGIVYASEIRATMKGEVNYWDKPYPSAGQFGPTVPCRASDHSVTLQRVATGH